MNSFPAAYIGRPHIYFESIDSTNAYALQLISKNNPTEGTAISSGYQSAGRGQIGRIWEGADKMNIYTSIILRPQFIAANDQFCLNQAISLAVSAVIEELLGRVVKVKWPNDIFVGDKKISGILIQNILGKKMLATSVVGIGININQEEFPVNIPHATSMYKESQRTFDLEEVRTLLFSYIEYWYEKLKQGNIQEIHQLYHENIYRMNEISAFVIDGNYQSGVIKGVDRLGKLRVEYNGKERSFRFNELQMII